MAMTSMQRPKSAANTRPRKRSSVLSCSSVLEKTHTVEVPECAKITNALNGPATGRSASAACCAVWTFVVPCACKVAAVVMMMAMATRLLMAMPT